MTRNNLMSYDVMCFQFFELLKDVKRQDELIIWSKDKEKAIVSQLRRDFQIFSSILPLVNTFKQTIIRIEYPLRSLRKL